VSGTIEVIADLSEVVPHSPEWHRLRQAGIGGSDAGAVCGLSKWRTPYQVWIDKTRELGDGSADADEPEYIRWGKLLEEPVRAEFSDRTGIEVHPFPKMVRNADYPWMLANVDGLTGPVNALDGVYEGKTTRFDKDWETQDDGSVAVPLDYTIQGMHYLAVLGLDVVHFACLVGGQQLRIAQVERNDTLIDDLVAIEQAFWQKVTDRVAPPVDGNDRSALSKAWTPKAGAKVELGESVIAILQSRTLLDARIKEITADRDAIDAQIMAALGEAEIGTWNGVEVVTWKSSERKTIDTKALREAHPALAAEFTKTSTSRRFLPKEIAS
jgi:putative phage-type endonuclease